MSSAVPLKHLEFDDKGDHDGACPNVSMVCKNVESESYCVASDISQHCEMPSKGAGPTVAVDKKIIAVDSCYEVDNVSCVSKADGSNGAVGHSGDNDQKILTGSSSSVNSFVPIGLKKLIDVRSSKHFSGHSEIVEGNNQFESLLQYAREDMQSLADFSDKSDPSETSSFKDEHAGGILPKVGLSSERGMNVVQNDKNYTPEDFGPLKAETKMDDDLSLAAASNGSEKNGYSDLKGPPNVKEPPLQCQMENNGGSDELVDVRVCDICGDVGQERWLALCSKCCDGAEHTYCMRNKMDKLPGGDWLCEECMEVGNPQMLVDIEEGADAAEKASSSEMGHGSGKLRVSDSSKDAGRTKLDHTSLPSCLGKRPGPDILSNLTTKRRALDNDVKLPSLTGLCARPVILKESNLKRGRGVPPTCVESSSAGDSSGKVMENAQAPMFGYQSKDRLIKSSGLEVHPQSVYGSREKNVSEKSATTKMRKKHILTKLRRCESFRISSPVCSVASDPAKDVGNDIKSPNYGIKCRTAQRSHSFDLKSSYPVSPLSGSLVSRVKTDKAAPFMNEVKQALVSRNGHHDPETTGVHRNSKQSSDNHTADKCPIAIFRNTVVSGFEEKYSCPPKDRRSTNPLETPNGYCHLKPGQTTDEMEAENTPKVAKVQLESNTEVRLDSSPARTMFLATFSHPNLDCVWRGIFKVEECEKLPFQCNGLQAHLSASASPKVPEVVCKLPCEIMLKEVLKRDIWPDHFRKVGPTESNIALYFFAEDLKSYRRYKKFLDCMVRNNLALQSNLDGVELLVFPSHYLPEKSQRWNKLFYLWGVFRAKNSSCLDNSVCAASPQKGIQNPEPESVPSGQHFPFPVLSGHRNECISVAASAALPVSIQGHKSTGMKESNFANLTNTKSSVRSFPDEVDAQSTDRAFCGEMQDFKNHQKEIMHQNSDKRGLHVSLEVENASHPAVERSACLKNVGFTTNGESQIESGFNHPQNESSSPINNVLYAVEVIENSKTSKCSFSVDYCLSDHGRWIDKQANHEVEPLEKASICHPLNLEVSLWCKKKPEKNEDELDLLLSLSNRKDEQIKHGDNDDGSGDGNVSLDLSLALPSESELPVLMMEDKLLSEKDNVDTSLQLFGGGRKA